MKKLNLVHIMIIAIASGSALAASAAPDYSVTETLISKWELCSQKVKQSATEALNEVIANEMKKFSSETVSGSIRDITSIKILSTDPASFIVTVPYIMDIQSANGFGGGVFREFVIQAEPFGKPGLLVPGMSAGTAIYGCRVTVRK